MTEHYAECVASLTDAMMARNQPDTNLWLTRLAAVAGLELAEEAARLVYSRLPADVRAWWDAPPEPDADVYADALTAVRRMYEQQD